MVTKTCKTCNKAYDISEFKLKYRDNRPENFRSAHCMKCDDVLTAEKLRKSKELALESIRNENPNSRKLCLKCDQLKFIGMFSRSNTSRDGRTGTCKPCISARRREKYNNNKEHYRERHKRVYRRLREKGCSTQAYMSEEAKERKNKQKLYDCLFLSNTYIKGLGGFI